MATEKIIPYKIYLEEKEMPTTWYNVRADMKNKPAPLLNKPDEQDPHKGAEDHDAFQRQVDHAASFGKNACERNDHQRNGINQGFADKE